MSNPEPDAAAQSPESSREPAPLGESEDEDARERGAADGTQEDSGWRPV